MDGVARMNAEWLWLDESVIFQSALKNISLQFEEELERGVWDSFEDCNWALLGNDWEQYCCEAQGNAFDFSEG